MTIRMIGVCALGAASLALGATPGQSDTFSAGTTENWTVGAAGAGGSPNWISTGGPAGDGDGFLRATSTGSSGSGGRMVVFNVAQWAGSLTGIDAIRMDVRNSGTVPLHVRMGFWGTNGTQIITADVFEIAPASGWQNIEIGLDDFGPAVSPELAQMVLASVFHVRIMSAEMLQFSGDRFAGTMDLDNITAGPFATPCPADLDGSGAVDGADLAILLAAWGSAGADLDADAVTSGSDLAILLAAWGPCPA